jgi:hypothetical protein
MPIFDNELLNGGKPGVDNTGIPAPALGSPQIGGVNTSTFGGMDEGNAPHPGMTLEELSNISRGVQKNTFSSPKEFIQEDVLNANKHYSIYNPDIDNEQAAAINQSWYKQLGNGLVKAGVFAVGTFANTFATIPDTINAIKNGKFSDLYQSNLENSTDTWLKNVEDTFPNYYSHWEQQHPFLSAVTPSGMGNFWGDKIFKNFGFTLGAIGGSLAQDAIVGTVTEGLGEIPLIANQVGKVALYLNKVFGTTDKFEGLLNAAESSNQINRLLKLKGFANPEEAQNLLGSANRVLDYTKLKTAASLAKIEDASRFALNLYSSARTEGGMEARDGYNTVKSDLTSYYRSIHGFDPVGSDLKDIEDSATASANVRMGINLALLSVSDAIQFDNILKPWGSAKSLKGSVLSDIEVGANRIERSATDPSLYSVKPIEGIGNKAWNWIKPAIPNILSEGIYEEGGQYAAQTGTANYYEAKYKKEIQGNLNDIVNSTVYGLQQEFGTTEGLENIFLGAFSGVLQGKLQQGLAKPTAKLLGNEYISPKQRAEEIASNLSKNSIFSSIFGNYDRAAISLDNKKQMDEAVANNDLFNYKNFKHKDFFTYVLSRIDANKPELIEEELNLLRDLPQEQFEKLTGMDKNPDSIKSVNEYVNSLLEKAKQIKDVTSRVNDTYNNPFAKDNSLHETFNNWKNNLSYLASINYDSKDRIDSIANNVSKIHPIDVASLSQITNKEGLAEYSKEIETSNPTLSTKIKVFLNGGWNEKAYSSLFSEIVEDKTGRQVGKDAIPSLINYGNDVNKIQKRQKTFLDHYDKLSTEEGWNNFVQQDVNNKTEEEVKPTTSKTITLKTLRGEQDFEIGKQYFAGAVIKQSAQGEYKDFSRFTIVGEHENGNIIIKTSDGKLLNIPKSSFEKYKINSVEEAAKHPGAVFYMENSDRVFKFQRKGKEDLEGKLEYDGDRNQLMFVPFDGSRPFPVNRGQFVAQLDKEGKPYKNAQIYSDEKLSEISQNALKVPLSEEEKAGNRSAIISDLYNKSIKRLKEVKDILDKNKNKLNDIEDSLKNLNNTKEGLLRKKFTKAIRKTILELSNTKTDIENEISQLEIEKEELENTIPYFEDLYQNSSELPIEGKEVISQLKEDINVLNQLIDNTKEAIKNGRSLIDKISGALKTATDMLTSFVKKLRNLNPSIPNSLDEFEENIAKFYGEENAKQFIADKLGFTEQIIDLQNQIDEEGKELKIPDMSSKIDELSSQINELQEGLKDLEKERLAKEKILQAFEKFAEEFKKKEAEKAELIKKQEAFQQLFVAQDKSGNNNAANPDRVVFENENKKSAEALFSSTTFFSTNPKYNKNNEEAQPHHLRANYFGGTIASHPERAKFKATLLHDGMGENITPIIKLAQGTYEAKEENDRLLLQVHVKEEKDGIYYVDQFGDIVAKLGAPLTEEQLNKLVFQNMPKATDINWSSGEAAARIADKEVAEANLAIYREQRKLFFEETEPSFFDFRASNGFDKVDGNGKRIFTSSTPQPATNFGNIDNLQVKISTNVDGTVTNGTTTVKVPIGRPILITEGGVEHLENRKLTENEKNVIFKALKVIAKKAIEGEVAENEITNRLFTYLRGVIYWGIPKNDAGRNSMWFTKDNNDVYSLHFGKNGSSILMTDFLVNEENAKRLTETFLNEMFNNANVDYLNKNDVFFEIKDLNEETGEIKQDDLKRWSTYTEYLLSPEGRTNEELPLYTKNPPFIVDGNQTRDGIYFTLGELESLYNKSMEKPRVKDTPAKEQAKAKMSEVVRKTASITPEAEGKLMGLGALFSDIETDRDLQFEKYSTRASKGASISPEEVQKFVDTKKLPPLYFEYLESLPKRTKLEQEIYDIVKSTPKQEAPLSKKQKAINSLEKVGNEWRGVADDVDGSGADEIITDTKEDALQQIEQKYAETKPVETVQKEKLIETVNDNEIGRQVREHNPQILHDVVDLAYEGKTAQEITDELNKKYDLGISRNDVKQLREYLGIPKSDISVGTGFIGGGTAIGEKTSEQQKAEFQDWKNKIDRIKSQLTKPTEVQSSPIVNASKFGIFVPKNDSETRIVTENTVTPENWKRIEKWLGKKYPGVPVYRVKNMIQVAENTYAWGLYADGAIYLYEGAELGTTYHEVFHSVMNQFSSPEEKLALLKEFNNRNGSYTTRLGQRINYTDAKWKDVEEQLAEEFRNYVLSREKNTILGKIGQFFKDLYSFITGLKKDKSGINQLFKDINGGKYRNYVSSLQGLSFAKKGIMDVDYVSTKDFQSFETSIIPPNVRLTAIEEKELMMHMTSRAFDYLYSEQKDLFAMKKLNADEFYHYVKEQTLGYKLDENNIPIEKDGQYVPVSDGGIILQRMANANNKFSNKKITESQYSRELSSTQDLHDKILSNWELVKANHKIYMQSYSYEFDENNELVNKDENKTGRETGQDAMKIDSIRRSNPAMKLLFSTIKQATWDSLNGKAILSPTKVEKSSIGGDMLAPFGRSFIDALNALATSTTFDSMMDRLVNLGQSNPNFVRVFTRLKGNRINGKIKWNELEIPDVQALIAFYKTFAKQAPEVVNHYIDEDGSAYLGSGNIANATESLKEIYENAFIKTVRNSPLFTRTTHKNLDGTSKVGWEVDGRKLREINTQSPAGKLRFLEALGIKIEEKGLNSDQRKDIYNAASGIYTALQKAVKENSFIATIDGKTFDIGGALHAIAEAQVQKQQTSGLDSVFFNIDREMQQTFVEKNHPSKTADAINETTYKDDLLNTGYKYLVHDTFSQNSQLLNWLYKNGQRINKLRIGYVNGTIDEGKGKRTTTDKLKRGQRLLQQINLNLSGWYYTIVPADSSTEWMVNMPKFVNYQDIVNGYYKDINIMFKNYLLDEFNLAKEKRTNNVDVEKNNEKLRFFRGILGDTLSAKIENANNFEEIYSQNEDAINTKISSFFDDMSKNIQKELKEYGIVNVNEKGFLEFKSLNNEFTFNKNGFTEKSFDNLTRYIAMNYAIANMEMFKTMFGDPYSYKDVLKRIKSFLSPAEQSVYSSPEINEVLNDKYNLQELEPDDIGYRHFKDYVNTTVIAEIKATHPIYSGTFDEADAQGLITEQADRELKIKAGIWNQAYNSQYEYNMAWERHQKAGKNADYPTIYGKKYVYKSKELEKHDEDILKKNPLIDSLYITKPIVRGSKYDTDINDPMIDKYSLAPISYRLMMQFKEDSNMVKLYNKMSEEGLDYVVFESARKVGSQGGYQIYDKDGSISSIPVPLKLQTKVAFQNFSIQVQTTPKTENKQTLGSQLTKLASLDLIEGGVPVDFKGDFANWLKLSDVEKKKISPLYKEITHNQEVLENLIELGYENLLKRLGMVEDKNGLRVEDRTQAARSIRAEILRREVNDNILKSLDKFEKGEIALESTPLYQQFKNVLYSIVDKNVTSMSVTGGPKVQMASTFFESKRIEKETIKGKPIYTSTDLQFFEGGRDGSRTIEVYLSSKWLRKQLKGNPLNKLSDEELIKKCSPEVLKNLGFRIPSQNSNSFDVFTIKAFLPQEMGDTIVLPSAFVKKTGGDFDIDKMNTYLKNIYVDKDTIKELPYFKTEAEANEFLIKQIVGKEVKPNENALEEYENEDDEKEIFSTLQKSLQNEYFNSLQRLISSKENYDKLTSPNDATKLKALADEIAKARNLPEEAIDPSKLLDMPYINQIRHNYIIGKGGVGIGAASQVNHANSQRAQIYIDWDRMDTIPIEGKEWIYSPDIKLTHNEEEVDGKFRPSLSKIKDQVGNKISDVISSYIDGWVDIAKGAWIINLGATPNVASTFLFLHRIGVPMDTVVYFMNQPIIVEYLKKIDKAGYSWLFIDSFVNDLVTTFEERATEIDEKSLKGNVGKDLYKMSNKEKAQQDLILFEFLKYAQLAQHLFHVQQGTNWDTATMNDPYLETRKSAQLEKARNTLISSPDKILEATFLGKTSLTLKQSRNAISKILPTDSIIVRNVIQKTLVRYIDLPERQFIKAARSVVQSFLDYVIQTDAKTQLNNQIPELMVNEDKNIPTQIKKLYNSLPQYSELRSNPVLSGMATLEANKDGGVFNMKLATKNAEIYEQNAIIAAFQELKTNPLTAHLYDGIVRLSLLQGLANSPISFTQFLPVEDLVEIMQPIIARLDSIPGIDNFSDMYMYERNNWNNTNVVPSRYEWKKTQKGVLKIYNTVGNLNTKNLTDKDGVSSVVGLNTKSRKSDSDVITIIYKKDGYSNEQIATMRKNGDYSYMFKGLYQMVKNADGTPLLEEQKINKQGDVTYNYIFKQINAWGDGFKLQEYYNQQQKSVVNNGYDKVDKELDDRKIISEFHPNSLPSPKTQMNIPSTKQGFKLSSDKTGKDQGKADLANAYIGYGVQNRDSSTGKYLKDAQNQGILTNENIIPTKNTVAFVSVASEGTNVDKTIEQAKRVLQAGGTIIMDRSGTGFGQSHSSFNKNGEGKVQDALGKPTGQTTKGYNYWGNNPEKTIAPKGRPAIDDKNENSCK